MSAVERGLYVAVGAADFAAQKVRELPPVKAVAGLTSKWREKSIIEQAREIEPRVRRRAAEFQERGEKVVERLRADAKKLREQVRELPADTRTRLRELPDKTRRQAETLRADARRQLGELRQRVGKVVRQGGAATKTPEPATEAKASPRPVKTAATKVS